MSVKEIHSQECTLRVSRTTFNQTTEDEGKIEIRPFATQPASVRVSLGRTVNLGNFNSAKISIDFTVPCYREEMVTVYRETLGLVNSLLDEEVSKITGAFNLREEKASIDALL